MPPCATCGQESVDTCAWCESGACRAHSKVLLIGDEVAAVPFTICTTCAGIWNAMRPNPDGEGLP